MSAKMLLAGSVFLDALLLAGGPTASIAQAPRSANVFYQPGYVDMNLMPLAAFAPKTLRASCQELQHGNTDAALAVFGEYISHHPSSFVAYLGYSQAHSADRDKQLEQYQQEAKKKDTAINAFKVGTVAFYMLDSWEYKPDHSYDFSPAAQAQRQRLSNLAQASLLRAYDLSHEPLVGFMLANVYDSTGGPPVYVGRLIPLYEDIIRRMGGPQTYKAYLQAKNSGWVAPQPPIPALSSDGLKIFRHAVGGIWVLSGGRGGTATMTRLVNGKSVTATVNTPYTTTEKNAMAYLSEWRLRLKNAADKAGD